MLINKLFKNKGGEDVQAKKERKLQVLSKAVENNKLCNSGTSIDDIVQIVQNSDIELNYKGI